MKTRNSNYVNMINTTITFSDANTAATAGIPAYVIIIGQVKAKMVLINSLNQIGDGTTTGVTLDTKVLRGAMTELALKCGNATLAYANSIHNNTLAALVNFSETELNRLKKEDVDDVCEAIHDATNANLAGATPFGVNVTDVTDLQAAIDLYRTTSQDPRQALITKSQAKKNVTNMIREVIDDLMVAQMDKMVNTLKNTNKDFYDGYKQAREILNLGSSTTKASGTVLDENDVPLKGVLFVVKKAGTNEKVAEVETDVKGKYSATKLPVGDFDLSWELNGYKTVTETDVHIAAGKDLRRRIVMNKIFVIEGDLMTGLIANIDVDSVNATPTSVITVEVAGSALRFYASPTANGAPGAVFMDVQPGQVVTKTEPEFAALVGFSDANGFLNVQNIGMMSGHYQITFDLS